MSENALGEYIERIREKHPRLSMRKMALEAGLNGNAVQQIVSGRTGASPAVLKAISDRWGTDDDYRELMRLAGHPLPEPAEQWGTFTSFDDVDAMLARLEKSGLPVTVTHSTAQGQRVIIIGDDELAPRRPEPRVSARDDTQELINRFREMSGHDQKRLLEIAEAWTKERKQDELAKKLPGDMGSTPATA